MRYVIDKDICEKNGLEVSELLSILLLNIGKPYKSCIKSLLSKGILKIEKTIFGESYTVNPSWKDKIANLVIEEEPPQRGEYEERFLNLASQLIELFPKGRKEGTNYMWRDSKALIAKRLKTIIKKYDVEFTDEEAIDATKRYVASFNGDYTYMQLLKYFIMKKNPITGEENSQLLSFIENKENSTNKSRDIGELV